MLLCKVLLPSLLAAVATAAPAMDMDTDLHPGLESEMELFKRDSVLDARDLELADTHGVDLNEMYKHAVIKREDGDHITIWVEHGFVAIEEEDAEDVGSIEIEGDQGPTHPLTKRQTTRLAGSANYVQSSAWHDTCSEHKRQDHTGPNAPFSGGVLAIKQWAENTKGRFLFGSEYGSHWRSLVIAGSNSGANARYRAKMTQSLPVFVISLGTSDMRNDADWTYNRRRSFNGRWRASSHGGETCRLPAYPARRFNYQIIHAGNTRV